MKYRELGRSGLEVSVIAFGASPLGNVFADVSSSAANRAVSVAIEQGINLFDVSPYYGDTLAEARLGEALIGKRDQILLATKCGRYGTSTFDFSARTIMSEFDRSLRRLKTDHVDLLQAHDIEFGDVGRIITEAFPAMQRLKEQGKVRLLGLTSYWPGLLARVATQVDVDCVLNYCHANLFVDDMDLELVPFVEKTGIGLLNASPLHMGLLGDRPVPVWHPAPQAVRDTAAAIRLSCERFDVDPGTLGLRVCLDHDAVASTLVGISSEAEVNSACAALNWNPPEELMQEVRGLIEPVHNLTWPSGLEANQDAPQRMSEVRDRPH